MCSLSKVAFMHTCALQIERIIDILDLLLKDLLRAKVRIYNLGKYMLKVQALFSGVPQINILNVSHTEQSQYYENILQDNLGRKGRPSVTVLRCSALICCMLGRICIFMFKRKKCWGKVHFGTTAPRMHQVAWPSWGFMGVVFQSSHVATL